MLVTELGIATEVRRDSAKACSPMFFTELGMVISVSPEQQAKACSPMFVTELGMVTDVRPVQP